MVGCNTRALRNGAICLLIWGRWRRQWFWAVCKAADFDGFFFGSPIYNATTQYPPQDIGNGQNSEQLKDLEEESIGRFWDLPSKRRILKEILYSFLSRHDCHFCHNHVHQSYIGHISVIYQSYIGHISVIYQSYISNISVIYQPYISHISFIYQLYTIHISFIYQSYISHISVIYQFYISHISVLYQSYISPI